ncbi:ABC transporter permease (plasmid) [Fulvitalea axinellae]|uniref:ABC transporter permease n=1 Tax=Fulvitalea axinellae TaxID=1182444 RepID=A0AAU9CQ96_9BACT|nr:ABC transporter permease [Fulvitalea axinellae]
MLFYYLKISFRRLLRNRVYSLVNILGLGLGLSVSLWLFNYAYKEWQTDRWQKGMERVFRLGEVYKPTGSRNVGTGYWVIEGLKDRFPGLKVGRLTQTKMPIHFEESEANKKDDRGVFSADYGFLEVMRFKPILGSIKGFGDRPNQLVLTESVAKQYFPNESPIGKKIMTYYSTLETSYEVLAVIPDFPEWSSLRATAFIPLRKPKQRNTSAIKTVFETYIELPEDLLLEDVFSAITEWRKQRHSGEEMSKQEAFGQEFYDMYFGSSDTRSFRTTGSRFYTLGMLSLGVLVLVLSLLNYSIITVSSIGLAYRRTEIRRSLGESRPLLIVSYAIESGTNLVFASLVAIALTVFSYPFVNRILDFSEFDYFHMKPTFLYHLFVLYSICWAIMLVVVWVGEKRIKGLRTFGKSQVILQLITVCVLLICSVVFLAQLDKLRREMGFAPEKCAVVYFSERAYNKDHSEVPFMQALRKDPLVLSCASGIMIPRTTPFASNYNLTDNPDRKISAACLVGDQGYISTLGITILKGKDINPQRIRRSRESRNFQAVINEKMAKALGIHDDPIGKRFEGKWIDKSDDRFEIIGVVKDFQHTSFLNTAGPAFITDWRHMHPGSLIIKYAPGTFERLRERVIALHQQYYEGTHRDIELEPFSLSSLHKKEVQFGKVLFLFTGIGLFIVCLGLFGVSYFTAETRTKEIGIRKANGATTFEILRFLNSSTLKQVAVAFVIAVPIAYYAIGRWLENFAYKTEMSWWIFAGAGLLAGLVALATVSWQSWRAASREPVEALRYE